MADTLLYVRFGRRTVGIIEADDTARIQFTYDPSWLSYVNAFPISVSLPLRSAPWTDAAAAWFANLLPEAGTRAAVCARLGISEGNDLALLRAIGGECAGALTISDRVVEERASAAYEEITPARIASLVRSDAVPLLLGGPAVRLSLAGAQHKLPVTLLDGRLHLPLHGSPSTHLLKLPDPRFAHLPLNEAFVMGLAGEIGFDIAHVDVFDGTKPPGLLVERYDRRGSPPTTPVTRLHQEDFCQATGRPSARKYQEEGGPTLAECVAIVTRHTSRPIVDVRRLIEWQAFNVIVGNCDGHGKNLSLLYDGGDVRLAPFYDVLSTRQYPSLDRKLAMGVGGRRDPAEVQRSDWELFAREANLGARVVLSTVSGIVERCLVAIPTWTTRYRERHGNRAILQTLPRWITRSAERVQRGLKAPR